MLHHISGAQVLLPLPCRSPRLIAALPPSVHAKHQAVLRSGGVIWAVGVDAGAVALLAGLERLAVARLLGLATRLCHGHGMGQ